MKKNCVICGSEFDCVGRALVCSRECKRKRICSNVSEWRRKNPDGWKALAKRAYKKKRGNDPSSFVTYKRLWVEKNPEKMKEYSRRSYQKIKSNEVKSFSKRVNCTLRKLISETRKSSKSVFSYLGVASIEELIICLNNASPDPNWMNSNYHIDHVWQIHWFDLSTEESLSVIHNIKNLRPLEGALNTNRSKIDFWPLKKDDLEIYRPFLKEHVLVMIEAFFNIKESITPCEWIKRTSVEEKKLFDLIMAQIRRQN